MKKIISMLASLPVLFAGCSKDGDDLCYTNKIFGHE
jgi:hypothetical protein